MFIDFRDRIRERGRNIDVRERIIGLPPVCALTEDQTHNLGTCPNPGSNSQPFGV